MRYRVSIPKQVRKEIANLPVKIRAEVRTEINKLKDNPRPVGCTKLTAMVNHYRIRVGDYRVVYQISDKELIVLVVAAGHRKDIYKKYF